MTEKEYIKSNLKKILKYYGLKENSGTNWDCLDYRHNNHFKKMTVRNDYCCCHCGIKGDSLNVIAYFEGYTNKEFTKTLEKAREILNIENEQFEHTNKPNNPNKKEQEKKIQEHKNLKENLLKLDENIKNALKSNLKFNYYWYFKKRGINNKELLNKMLIMNPEKIIPSFFYSEKSKKYLKDYTNIIPILENGKVVNCILRKNNNNGLKVLNLKNAPLKIYNADILRNELRNEIIFITEGIFDCLSFENENRKAISINSITMSNRLFDIININKKKYKNVVFVIAFDFDFQGKKNYGLEAAQNLQKKLTEININSKILKIQKYNDINDYYVQDKESFIYRLEILEKALNRIIYRI